MRISRSHCLLSLGGFLIFAHRFVAETLLAARYWATLFYPGDPRHQMLLLAAANFALIPIGCACLLAAWWVKPDRSWWRLAAMTASVILIFGFPLLIPFTTMCLVTFRITANALTVDSIARPASGC